MNDTAPTGKAPESTGAVSDVQSDVSAPPLSVPHTCTVKPVLLAEATSTPVRVYPSAFEPVVKACETAT